MAHLTPYLHGAFGDVYRCEGKIMIHESMCWDWGVPHYWAAICMGALFFLSLVNFMIWANKKSSQPDVIIQQPINKTIIPEDLSKWSNDSPPRKL